MREKHLYVHIGGSNRKYERTIREFNHAGILIEVGGHFGKWGSHHSNWIPDTAEAREILKKCGGTVTRKQLGTGAYQNHLPL